MSLATKEINRQTFAMDDSRMAIVVYFVSGTLAENVRLAAEYLRHRASEMLAMAEEMEG